jgi:uncharacterized RDD family membrane protein YckC
MTMIPKTIPTVKEDIYAGFWPRFFAGFIDGLIFLPLLYLFKYIDGFSKYNFCITSTLTLLFFIFYEVYLVKQYGGSLGKLVLKLKIIRTDGLIVGWKESFMRYSVSIAIHLISVVIVIIAVQHISDDIFFNVSFWKRSDFIDSLGTHWWDTILAVWFFSEFIVLQTNDRKRAVHDFIAGTVVINARYHDDILEHLSEEKRAEC